MAAARKMSDDEDAGLRNLEKEIAELRSSKKELFQKVRPVNDELERIAQRERQCVDEMHRLSTEIHDRDKQQHTIQRLVELESEIEQLKREKRENISHTDINNKLKQSLDQAMKYSRQQQRKIIELNEQLSAEHELRLANVQAISETAHNSIVDELQKQLIQTTERLNKTKQDLSVTRQRLPYVQERLTVAEQVTAATQQRALQESDNSEELQLELTQHHQPTSHTAGSEILRSLYSDLTMMLDTHIVAVNMYQRNALTLKELQTVQSLRDRPVEAAEMLLNIILEQPDAVYLCFLDVLKHAGQHHVYQTLVEGGYKDCDDQSSHTKVIRANYVFLLETLDVKISGLVGQLYSDHVVSAAERDDISAELTSFRANEKLLAAISRKSPQQFQLFLDALDSCGQQHVRNVIDDLRAVTTESQTTTSTLATTTPTGGTAKSDSASTPIVVTRKSETTACTLETVISAVNAIILPVTIGRKIGTVPVGQIVHTLLEGPPVLGITSLAGEIYLLRDKGRDEVEVYDVITHHLQRCLTVPDIKGTADMTSCKHHHCVYISDHNIECIHRLDVQGVATRWAVNDKPRCLSVNAVHSLLVACDEVRKIKEFTSHGDLLRELTLPDDVVNLWHAIQLTSGQFIVCHGNDDDAAQRVCMITADGCHIVHSHGGEPGSDTGQFNGPAHLAVDNNEFVFVADVNNRRVTLLSPTFHYVRQVVSSDKLKWHPDRLYLDVQKRRLYVADNEWKDGKVTSGRVVVFSV